LRVGPARTEASQGVLPNGSATRILCQVTGQQVAGSIRTTTAWNRLANGLYVSDAFVSRPDSVDPCPAEDAAAVPAATDLSEGAIAASRAGKKWVIPVPTAVGSGFRSPDRPSHDGVDLAAPRNTPIQAVSAGTVITSVCNTSNGSCDLDGSPKVSGCGWYVEIQHTNDAVTRYCHLVRRPSVTVGQSVVAGQVIGYVGTSGNSSGPHLHFEVHTSAPASHANAIDPVSFMKRLGAPLRIGD
jgi:murein DD-endopeptidase MepM/ murein hydrolase activator NlpD